MLTVPYEKRQLSNFEVLERLAAAWNPPEVSGKIQLVEGSRPNTLHVCFTGHYDGRELMICGNAIDETVFCDPSERKVLARALRDYFASALDLPGDGAPAKIVENPRQKGRIGFE